MFRTSGGRASSRRVTAHSYRWEYDMGPIPLGCLVYRTCHNVKCVRLDHLACGTRDDMYEHMRLNDRYRPARGEASGSAILSRTAVLDIRRRLLNNEVGAEIARLYGVSPSAISAIHSGRTWAHVEDE